MFLGLPLRAWQWIGFLLACLALWAGVVWAVHAYNEHLREQGRDEIRASWKAAVDREQAHQDAIASERRQKQQEADDAHAQALARAAADAAGAHAAADRLRRQLADFVAAGRTPGADRPAAGQRPGVQGADPLDLLANMFSRADGVAGDLAEYVGQLRAAGELCEGRFDALMSRSP